MNDIDPTIQTIRDRDKAATPGPWTLRDGWGPAKDGLMRFTRLADAQHDSVLIARGRYGELAATEADAEFIAAARDAVPYLLGEVDRMRGEWDRLVNERADLLGRIHSLEGQLTAANCRGDGLEADLRSAVTANTNYANENARVRQDRDTQADIAQNRADVITDLGEVIERVEQRANVHTAVVEAAKALTGTVPASLVTYFGARGEGLVAAVDALPKTEVAR